MNIGELKTLLNQWPDDNEVRIEFDANSEEISDEVFDEGISYLRPTEKILYIRGDLS